MIPVTKPFLPPMEEYNKYIAEIWNRQWLTNNGPLVNELELKLKQFLNLKHLLFLTNGTIALQIAIKAMGLKGKIITTPFSYVATTSSIVWEGCEPVFADIDPDTLNIDPDQIEKKLKAEQNICAILATHVYGNPCDIDRIQSLADRYKVKIIYDAAHCFGTKYKGRSVFEYGDISTVSFHATKLFHTIEGGAVITKDAELLRKMSLLRNFGHDGPYQFSELGINGKNSEMHAAMGLVNLRYIRQILQKRRELSGYYSKALKNADVTFVKLHDENEYNYSYYPVLFPTDQMTNKVIDELNKNWIYPRRYFYPSLTLLPYVDATHMPVTDLVSSRVLCLPLFHTLTIEEIDFIARIILRVQNN